MTQKSNKEKLWVEPTILETGICKVIRPNREKIRIKKTFLVFIIETTIAN